MVLLFECFPTSANAPSVRKWPKNSENVKFRSRKHAKQLRQKMAWVFVVAGFFWLGILLALTMTDYLTRGSLGVVGH
jgi:hypothetical protein